MAKYIGKRIVPVHCGRWDQMKAYEMLSIVLEEISGDSYISRRAVPSGTAITDTNFWVLHSLYSQQIKDMSDQVSAAEARIKADNDQTENSIRDTNQATVAHIDEAIGQARADLNEKWSAADTDMRTLKAQYQQTVSSLNARMDSIAASASEGSDVEVADARINNAGFAFDTLGGALRDVDKRVDIAIEEAGAIDFALSHGGEVTLDTGEWVYGSLNPDTGGVEEASRQVIHTKDYLKLPPSTRFSLGADFRLRIIEYKQEGSSFVYVSGKDWIVKQDEFCFNPDSWYIFGLYSPELKTDITLAHKSCLTLTCSYFEEERLTIAESKEKLTELEAELANFKGSMVDRIYGMLDSTFEGFELWDYHYGADGGGVSEIHQTGANYKTFTMEAPEDFDCYFEEPLLSNYTSISLYHDAIYDQSHYIHRYRHYSNDDDLPTKENPLHVSKGMGVAITVFRERDFHWYLNLSSFGIKFGDIHLSKTQTDEVDTLISSRLEKTQKHCMVQYSPEGTGKEHTTEHIDIYIPTVVGYLHYEFGHCVYAPTNADNWRISLLYSVDDDLNERFGITQRGEWEMAITLKGRSDFMGGIAHGDEVVKNIAVYVDGRKTALSDLTQLTRFEELKIVEQTELFDPNDSTTHVADHGKEYVFNADELHLRQTVQWLVDEELGTSYMLMFPVYRGNDAASALQVTDHFYANDDFTEYDVSVGGDYNSGGYGWRKNVTMATIYSEKSGFCGTVEMIEQPVLGGGGSFMVQRTLNSYNKLYWSIAGTTGDAFVHANDRWYVHTRYQFSVTDGTDVGGMQ